MPYRKIGVMSKAGKHTRVYSSGSEYYVRFGLMETNQFPHGLALATSCKTKEESARFSSLVDDYIDEFIELNGAN